MLNSSKVQPSLIDTLLISNLNDFILTQAVCCSDHIHCCPSGHTCDVEKGTCDQGSEITTMVNQATSRVN